MENKFEMDNETILKIAEAIHNDYIRQRKSKGEKIEVPEKFSDLTGEYEETEISNIKAAEDIIPKLNFVNIGLRKVENKNEVKEFTFSDADIEKIILHFENELNKMKINNRWL